MILFSIKNIYCNVFGYDFSSETNYTISCWKWLVHIFFL